MSKYSKHNLPYILTFSEAIEKTFIYSQAFKNELDFFEDNDQMNFNACQILLLVIGEESKKMEAVIKKAHSVIPWNLITSLRNRIAHDYRSIDPFISHDIIRNHLPRLKIRLIQALKNIHVKNEFLNEILNYSHYKHLAFLKN